MATSLTEAAKYTTNMVKRGVLMTIVKDSVIMSKLPFINVVGNAYQYLRETTLPTINFYGPGDIWTENTGDTTQKTAGITILGGDADLDNFVKATRSDKTDLQAETIEQKAKALKHTFLTKFWYGDSATTNEFDGVHKICNGSDMTAQVTHQGSGSTGAALSVTNMDIASDLILDGKADCIVTTRAIRRNLMKYLRSLNNIEMDRDEFGNPVRMWNSVPLEYDDFLLQTETISSAAYSAATGGATGSMFWLRFGTLDLLGLQNGGLEVVKIGQVQSKDAMRYRIKWYLGLALMRTLSMAIIDGITNVTAVA